MKLTVYQIDALTELINMGIGHAAGVLNTMLCSHVLLRVPIIEILSRAELEKKTAKPEQEMLSAVQIRFNGPFAGNASIVFPTESAVKLVTLLTGENKDSPDLDAIMIGTLTEVGNIVLNGVMGAIANELKDHIRFSVPNYIDDPGYIWRPPGEAGADVTVIWVQTQFTIEEHKIDGDIVLILEMGSLDLLLAAIKQKTESFS